MANATHASTQSGGLIGSLRNFYTSFFGAVSNEVTRDLGLLLLRVPIALVFWNSGRTKVEKGSWNPLNINDSQAYLFGERFGLPFPELMATFASLGEHILPILLILGIFTRFGATGMLIMTAVIQYSVPTGWTLHLMWSGILLTIIVMGPGRLSLDHILGRMYKG